MQAGATTNALLRMAANAYTEIIYMYLNRALWSHAHLKDSIVYIKLHPSMMACSLDATCNYRCFVMLFVLKFGGFNLCCLYVVSASLDPIVEGLGTKLRVSFKKSLRSKRTITIPAINSLRGD